MLLFADGGTRPYDNSGSGGALLDFNDGLATRLNHSKNLTNNSDRFRNLLADTCEKGFLQKRVPIDRHGKSTRGLDDVSVGSQ